MNAELISVLECPICTEFMVAPISQCSNGHNICGTCKKKVVKCPTCGENFTTRNRALEHLSETTNFPCENDTFGCLETMLISKRDQHARVCPYRLYECLAGKRKGCRWTGRKKDITVHVREKHKEVAWMRGAHLSFVVQNMKLPKEVWDCQLLQAHDEIFWLHQHYSATQKTVFSAVQFLGPAELAKNFMYKITFASELSEEKVSMTCFTHADFEDIATILKPENCAYVEFWKLSRLVHNYKVKFEIKIKKLSNNK